VFLGRGAGEIATDFGLNASFGDILTGIILFFIIGCEFFVQYKVKLRVKNSDASEKEVA
jgi:simple sugar transport system permease protein